MYRIPLDKGAGFCYIITTKGKTHVHIESPSATQRNGKCVPAEDLSKGTLRHTSYLAYENVEWFDERKRTEDESSRRRGRKKRKSKEREVTRMLDTKNF